ncbi:MAG: alkaline phosphatase family protein, partial [Solirubrobacteraceae bacterium]
GSSIRHVFIIVLENESASTTFAPGSPAPYLATTLRSQGAYVPNYYGVGHNSNDNYIAMISGQAPNAQTQADCQNFTDMLPGTIGAGGQAQGTGCVYPTAVPTIASQLGTAGFTWRSYNEDMGADPARETSVCAHPAINATDNTQTATATDEYATRHNPFVYFHGIIDDTTLCNTHVVGLDALAQDLTAPASGAPNYSFITPDLCNDGHDAPCKKGQPGGLVSADRFLQTWVPRITASPAYRQDGLLMVLFDEAGGQEPSSCCGEIPGPGSPIPGINGPGGGRTGAVLLSPCIAPGTVTQTAYNHYSMLASVEDSFGLSHIGYASGPGATPFGSDIYNRSCGAAAPAAAIAAPSLLSRVSSRARIPVRWSATTTGGTDLSSYTVRVVDLGSRNHGSRLLAAATRATGLVYRARAGHTYAFTVTATNLAGQSSPVRSATVLVPSGVRPAGGHYSRGWRVRRVRGAWQGRAIASGARGATLTLRYRGGPLALIGEKGARGGVARVTLDGRSRVIRLHARGRLRVRQVIYRGFVRSSHHRLTVQVLRGTVTLEGVAIAGRRS